MFLLFAGYCYYPNGGWRDFQGSYKNLEECNNFAITLRDDYDWYEIVDLDKEKIIGMWDNGLYKNGRTELL